MPRFISSPYLKLLFMFRKFRVGDSGFLLLGAVCFGQPGTQTTPIVGTSNSPHPRGAWLLQPHPAAASHTHAQGPGVSGAEQPCLVPAGEGGVAFPWRRDWRLRLSKGVTGCQHLRRTLCFYVLPIFEIQLLLVNRHVTMSRISSVFIFISVWALLFLMSPAVG